MITIEQMFSLNFEIQQKKSLNYYPI